MLTDEKESGLRLTTRLFQPRETSEQTPKTSFCFNCRFPVSGGIFNDVQNFYAPAGADQKTEPTSPAVFLFRRRCQTESCSRGFFTFGPGR